MGGTMDTTQPRAYLSVYSTHHVGHEGERRWQVHYGSSSLCVPTDEATARHIWADHRRMISAGVTQRHLLSDWPEDPPVWDGDSATWSHLSGICRESGCDRYAKPNGTGYCHEHDYIN